MVSFLKLYKSKTGEYVEVLKNGEFFKIVQIKNRFRVGYEHSTFEQILEEVRFKFEIVLQVIRKNRKMKQRAN